MEISCGQKVKFLYKGKIVSGVITSISPTLDVGSNAQNDVVAKDKEGKEYVITELDIVE